MQYYHCDKYPIELVVSENIDKHFDFHNHAKHYVISVVMQGTAAVCLENRETACHRGDVFVVAPYVVHSLRQGKEARLLSLCVGTAFVRETSLERAEEIIGKLLISAVQKGVFGREQGEKLLASLQTVYRLRDQGGREPDGGIKILTDKIIGRPEQELPLETLAADIFVSKYYLIRKFKNSVGMTPHQFCIQNRIRKSQKMLGDTESVSGIAAEMGFYDQSHFDRAFRRIVGISPSEYIRSKTTI